MKPNFGFDLDGVLYPWAKAAYEYIKYRGLNDLPFTDFWKREIRGESPQSEIFWSNIVRDDTLYSMYPAKREDVQTVKELSRFFNIYYITHRPNEVKFTTYLWLKRYGFPCLENLVHTEEKKDIAVRLYDCKYYIDDRPSHNLQYVTRLFVPDKVYNNYSSFEYATIVENVSDILDLL